MLNERVENVYTRRKKFKYRIFKLKMAKNILSNNYTEFKIFLLSFCSKLLKLNQSHLMLLCLLSSILSVYSKTTYTVGGLFNVFDAAQDVQNDQIENFHAFDLALNQINADTDRFPDIELNFVYFGGTNYDGAGCKFLKKYCHMHPELLFSFLFS